jgi:triosephosphate isomerase
MTTVSRASRQPQRFGVALAITALSFASWTTAFMTDSRINQHNPLTRSYGRSNYYPGVLRSFGKNYLDFDNTQYDNAREQTQLPAAIGRVENRGLSNDRVPVIAGNWKLNPSTVEEASTLLKLLSSNFLHHRSGEDNGDAAPEVIVFPPFPYLERAISLLEGTGIKVGAQNVGVETKGAFTGEVSPSMVRSLGCDYVMVGHSERRTLFGESDDTINAKIKLSLQEQGLKIILCVGETLDEYENELLTSVVNLQLKKALKGITKDDIVDAVATVASTRLVIAYEPVWAIGTGKVATPEQAQVAHAVVRTTIQELYGSDFADKIQIQYGGSVTPDSISDLISMPDVDGALVGGASLTADGFTRIVDGAAA